MNAPSDASRIELRKITKRFDAVGEDEAPSVLNEIDLEIQPGESIAIVGPSGSGKSTLLNILGGLTEPTSGQVWLFGRDLFAQDAQALARARNRDIGYIFQSHHLLPQCSALENVLVPTLVDQSRQEKRDALDRAKSLLDRVGLGSRTSHRPAQLSGGECQRVAVVRALINRPKLLLADEPTGSLDGRSAHALGELLSELNREQELTLVTVTHSDAIASQMGRILALNEGRLQPRENGS